MDLTRITLFLALGATLMGAEAADAADKKARPKAEAGATVTVTAEASPIEVAKTPNPVKVLDKAVLERSGAKTLGELLGDLLPGQIMTNGGVGTAASTYLGGARSQDVVITLDGLRLTDASGLGGVNPNGLGLAGIERVEIQNGPCSSRFGAEAMGGVIALYTAGAPVDGLSGEVAETVGTQGIAGLRGSAAYGWGRGWARAAFHGRREDQATDTPKPFRTAGGFLGFGQELGQDSLLTVSYRNTYTGVPVPYSGVTPTSRTYTADQEARNRNEQVVGTLKTVFGTEWLTEFTLGHATQSRQEPGYPTGFSAFDSRRTQAVGRVHWTPSEGLRASFGADAYEETGKTPGPSVGEGRHLGFDLEGSWEPVGFLRLLGAVRQQWDRQSFEGQVATNSAPAATSRRTTWKLGANAMLGARFRAYASAGSGFSLPLLSAVMYNATNAGAPRLDREESTYANAGVTWEQGAWSARIEASRTLFAKLVYFDLNNYLYANGSEVRTQSLEGSLGYRLTAWGLEGFYRNQEARDLKEPEATRFSMPGVVRRPFNSFGLKGYAVVGAFRFDGRWGWFGPRYENFGYVYPTGSVLAASKVHFNDLSLAAAWSVNAAFSLTLRGDHLLQPRLSVADWKNRVTDGHNDAYQIFGFPAQPPTVSLEARYRF